MPNGGPLSRPTRASTLQMAGQSSSYVHGLYRHYRGILEIHTCMHIYMHVCISRSQESEDSHRETKKVLAQKGGSGTLHMVDMYKAMMFLCSLASWCGSRSV